MAPSPTPAATDTGGIAGTVGVDIDVEIGDGAIRGIGERGIGLGPQGGDRRSSQRPLAVDLSTCVSAYGPPESALAALRAVPAEVLARHPYGAADDLRAAYAAHLEVEVGELVAARGASEFVWQLASGPLGARVAVPLPAYTEYRQALPDAPAGRHRGGPHHELGAIAELMAEGRAVLVSNPHNPSGRAFRAAALVELVRSRPGGTLIVDESYVEFCAEPGRWSVVGAEVDNLAVVRSPSKFFGLAGARVGVAWSRSASLRAALTPQRGSWPVSAIEVAPVAAALADRADADRRRAATLDDTAWLDELLGALGSCSCWGPAVDGAVTHYRLVPCEQAVHVVEALAAEGVGARLLGPAHGLDGPAVRVAAPPAWDRAVVAAAFEVAVAGVGGGAGCGGGVGGGSSGPPAISR
jgi:histidinol-phosphate/aromatic aminotransferase/cobyric acid decarboxylase-like protein